MRDGHRSDCKACLSEAAHRYRETLGVEARRERDRRHYQKHREKRVASASAWRVANPERARANGLRSTRLTGWASQLAARSKATAAKRNWDFDLDTDFVKALYESQDGRCHWLGIKLEPSIEKRNPLQPSLDRLDCSKGYTQDNVVLACQFANMGRSEMSAERFAQFVSQLKEQFKSA